MRDDEATGDDSKPETPSVSISLTDSSRPECILLFQHLWEELGQLYGNTGPCEFSPADVQGSGCAFVVARLNRQAVGCGAIVPLAPGMAEVKRMFVESHVRRQGIAQQILRKLEAVARELGYAAVRLETGNRQPAAIRLYETAGYQHIERYGSHVEDELSICFEKRIGKPLT